MFVSRLCVNCVWREGETPQRKWSLEQRPVLSAWKHGAFSEPIFSPPRPDRGHRGEVATKVWYFGVKSTNVYQVQMGTKPAKVGRLQSLAVVNSAKVRRFCATKTPPPCLRSVGGPKLLKWGLSGRGSNLLKSDRPLTSTTPR